MLVLFASSAKGQTTAYAEAFDTLYTVDLPSHTATEIGSAGSYAGQTIVNLSGLSYSFDGTLYAVAGGLNALARIDASNGSATVVGSFGLSGQGDPARNDALDLSMTFGCDGTLWLASAYAGKLWTVDPSSGAATLVGATGHPITGIVARGYQLYGAGGRGDNTFYRIDTATGAATELGSFDYGGWINSVAMSFDDKGTLFAVLNYVPPAPGSTTVPDWSDLAKLDPSSGALTIIGPITGPDSLSQVGMKGFAIGPPRCIAGNLIPHTAPVGTPPWLAGLVLLLAAAAGWRLRRRATR
ncbi:MAG TPA: hypothetical protein VGO25_02230 [Rhodanobacteraceae bacterium]|jgi:hypothetical protein|nr:hypothetical protein [Rhodanobacteraceae bacterium]